MQTLPPFQTLLDSHRSDVMRFLVAAVGPNDADDCFQETFLSALRGYPELKDGRNLRGWLLTIAHRKAIDSRRGTRDVPTGGVADGLAATGGERRNGDSELWHSVAQLAPKQRAAVALRYACDLPYSEVASLMDVSEEAARRSVHDGIKRLREELTNG